MKAKFFRTEKEAMSLMRIRNAARRAVGNCREVFAVVAGPENDWAVVDLDTAIELGLGYSFE